MPSTVQDYASLIVALAAEIDPMVADLRAKLREIAAAEQSLHQTSTREGPYVADHLTGRRGIAGHAASLVADALIAADPATPRQTTGELAAAAWQEFTDI